jgi:hypothetical protein
MERGKAWGIGLGSGIVAAAVLVTAQAALGHLDTPACPAGWTVTSAPPVAEAEPLRACVRDGEHGPHASRVALYRTDERATGSIDAAMRAAIDAIGSTLPRAEPPTRAASADRRLDVTLRVVDVGDAPLNADVYLVAAGHRFGLLNIVHTPDAPFADPQRTADWMNAIEGVSPWGAPDAGPLRARCPEGFETRAAEGPRAVVRCIYGLGSSRFTLLSFAWDQGGMGSESERAQVASAIATRVAGAGGTARVIDGPVPFTLARNVDAIRTRVETGERVPVSMQINAATAVHGSHHVLGLGIAEPDVETVPVMSSMFVASGATRPPPWLTIRRAWGLAAVAVVLGAMASVALARRA